MARRSRLLKIILLLVIAGLWVASLILLWSVSLEIPSPESFTDRVVAESTKIYDRTGKILLYSVHEDIRRKLVPFEEISRHMKNATIAIEDSEFYEHQGIKFKAILRAFVANLGAGRVEQGGSTITQQLVKNSLLTREQKIGRKIKELILALKLERRFSKEQILSLYLNEIPYGGNIYGVEEAAQTFFGKPASELSLAESAYLAATPKAPTYYSPYGPNRDKLEARKNVTLDRMAELGFITPQESEEAKLTQVKFLPTENNELKAPHFVIWVRSYLEEKYGREAVRSLGLKVTTTLDWDLQQKAEEIVSRFGEENVTKFNANNAGLVAVEPKTGQILVMVGSRDYFDQENEGNFNITLAHRQPGSAFKPFVYAAALNKGFTPETIVFDLPTQFDTACQNDPTRCYTPGNYDNKFRGPITFREALAQSVNIPSIKVLYLAGIKDSLVLAKAMGISGLNEPERYGLTLVLGGGEVSLLELTSAYSVFANDGIRNPVAGILRIEDRNGNILEEFKSSSRQAIPENTARLISDILSDDDARAPLFGRNSLLYFPGRDVAAKTGTTNDYRDAWIVGYTPDIAVGVWAGNNDNSPMEKKIAGLIVSPMWNTFMQQTLGETGNSSFKKPAPPEDTLPPFKRGVWRGNQTYVIDKLSGKLATEYTPLELREEKVVTEVHSILFWLSGRGGNDPQLALWEEPVRSWASQGGLTDENRTNIPTEFDDIHTPELKPQFTIVSPQTNDVFGSNERINIAIDYGGHFPLWRLEAFLNEQYLGSVGKSPHVLSFTPGQTEKIQSENQLRVVAYDTMHNKTEKTIVLRLQNN